MKEDSKILPTTENSVFKTQRYLKLLWVENHINVIDFWILKWGK